MHASFSFSDYVLLEARGYILVIPVTILLNDEYAFISMQREKEHSK